MMKNNYGDLGENKTPGWLLTRSDYHLTMIALTYMKSDLTEDDINDQCRNQSIMGVLVNVLIRNSHIQEYSSGHQSGTYLFALIRLIGH